MKPTILIVDDEPGVRVGAERRAARRGVRRRSGRSGEACLDRVARGGVRRHHARRVAARHRRAGDARAPARAAGGFAGRHDFGARQHRIGGESDQDGRVRLRREAALARKDGPRRAQRAAPAAPGGREPGAARAGSIAPPTMVGESHADAPAARAGRDGRADQRPRADLRRERHGQGAGRADDSRAEPPAQRARSSR